MTESTEARFADDARRYRLDSRIATGGMGEVWRGTDTTLGRQVAVKLLKVEYADDSSFRSRFETEARHAASLHHPGVAAVYDFGEAAPRDGSDTVRPYLVMELVDGEPLSALLRAGEPMDPDVTRDLLSQAADAMAAAHAAGIVHRDIKPANLLVTPERQVKITDFGIARAADGVGLTQTGQVMGTPQYLSPEQARGGTATPASDVYSLGCVAFECLAGHRPFVAETPVATALAHLREPVPPLPDEVPADLAAVVRRALAKEPRDRFPDGAAFAAALRDPATAATDVFAPPPTGDHTQVMGADTALVAGAGEDATGPLTTAGPAGSRRKRSRSVPWLLIGGIALLIALVVGVLVYALGGDSTAPTDNPTPQAPHKHHTKPPPTTAPTTSEPTSKPTTKSPSPTPTTPTQAPTTSAPPAPTPTTPAPSSSSAPASQGSPSSAASIPTGSPSRATDGNSTSASTSPGTTTAHGKAAR